MVRAAGVSVSNRTHPRRTTRSPQKHFNFFIIFREIIALHLTHILLASRYE
jgi:hypothetical protein